MLLRLYGYGKSLFCFGGGIGIRGLGEIKLEMDCCYIRICMNEIKY